MCAPPARLRSWPLAMFSEHGWGKVFQVYVGIEVFIWMPALYATCYTMQPTVRLMQTRSGKQAVDRLASCLQRYTPSYHGRIVSLSSKINGAPRTRAFAEWVLLMKVLAPVAFPAKFYIASRIVGRGGSDDKGKGADKGVEPSLSEEEFYGTDGAAVFFQPPPSPPPPAESNHLQATALRWAHAHAGHARTKQQKAADSSSAQSRRSDDTRREPNFQ